MRSTLEKMEGAVDIFQLMKSGLTQVRLKYPELDETRINFLAMVLNDRFFVRTGYMEPGTTQRGYLIQTCFPPEMIEEKKFPRALKGMIAHELGHIVRGHIGSIFTFFPALYETYLESPKGTGIRRFMEYSGARYICQSVSSTLERNANREVMNRGLGKELLLAYKIIDQWARINGHSPKPYFYSLYRDIESKISGK